MKIPVLYKLRIKKLLREWKLADSSEQQIKGNTPTERPYISKGDKSEVNPKSKSSGSIGGATKSAPKATSTASAKTAPTTKPVTYVRPDER